MESVAFCNESHCSEHQRMEKRTNEKHTHTHIHKKRGVGGMRSGGTVRCVAPRDEDRECNQEMGSAVFFFYPCIKPNYLDRIICVCLLCVHTYKCCGEYPKSDIITHVLHKRERGKGWEI